MEGHQPDGALLSEVTAEPFEFQVSNGLSTTQIDLGVTLRLPPGLHRRWLRCGPDFT